MQGEGSNKEVIRAKAKYRERGKTNMARGKTNMAERKKAVMPLRENEPSPRY